MQLPEALDGPAVTRMGGDARERGSGRGTRLERDPSVARGAKNAARKLRLLLPPDCCLWTAAGPTEGKAFYDIKRIRRRPPVRSIMPISNLNEVQLGEIIAAHLFPSKEIDSPTACLVARRT